MLKIIIREEAAVGSRMTLDAIDRIAEEAVAARGRETQDAIGDKITQDALLAAALAGDLVSQWNYYCRYINSDSDKEAAQYCLALAAIKGHPLAMEGVQSIAEAYSIVGILRLTGYNKIEKNTDEAIGFLEQAAKLGHTGAALNLGAVFDGALDAKPRDIPKALQYFEQAAVGGHAKALEALTYPRYQQAKLSREKIKADNATKEDSETEYEFFLQYERGVFGNLLSKKDADVYLASAAGKGNLEAQAKLASNPHAQNILAQEEAEAQRTAMSTSPDQLVQNALSAQAIWGDVEAQWKYFLDYENTDSKTANYYLALAAARGHERAKNHVESNVQAQYLLGIIFLNGDRQIVKNTEEAISFLKKAVEKGHLEATFELGMVFYGVPDETTKDMPKALQYFEQAAAKGHSKSLQLLRSARYKKEKLSCEQMKADTGDAKAKYEFFLQYERGDFDTLLSQEKANYYLALAAGQGDAEAKVKLESNTNAQCMLGILWLYGHEGFKQDTKKAIEWFEQAAEQKCAEAQHRLGTIYMGIAKGDMQEGSVRINLKKAVEWLEKAAEQNYAKAQYALGAIYMGMIKNDVPEGFVRSDPEKAVEWFQKAAALKHPDAIQALCNIQKFDTDRSEQGKKTLKQTLKKARQVEARKQHAKDSIQKTTEAPQNNRKMCPKRELDDLLRTIMFDMDTQSTEIQKLVLLRTAILADIYENTRKLSNTLENNKNKSRLLTLRGPSLEHVKAAKGLFDKIKIQEILKEMNNLAQVCGSLQKATLAENEIQTLNKKFPGFSQLKQVLMGEMNDENAVLLQKTRKKLKAMHDQVITKQKELPNLKDVEALHIRVKTQKETVDEYRIAASNKDFPLSQTETDEIADLVKNILGQIEMLQTPETRQEPSRTRERVVRQGAVTVGNAIVVHVQPNANDAANGEKEQQAPKKKISKAERRAIYKSKCKQEIEERKILEERSLIDAHRLRTAKDIAAGLVPIRERKVKEETKVSVEHSEILIGYLEQLDTIIKDLKTRPLGQLWTLEERYALLGSFAQVSELVMQETKDGSIKRVAQRIRNALYKQPAIQVMGDSALLDTAENWHKFLQKDHLGSFQEEEGVLKGVDAPPAKRSAFRAIYNVGKDLDLGIKDTDKDCETYKKIANTIDIPASSQCIKNMKKYLEQRASQGQTNAIIQIAAEEFFWAIMDSLYVGLRAAKTENKPEAKNTLVALRSLFPTLSVIQYFTEVRDRGVLSRHPLARLKQERANLLSVLEKAKKSESATLSSAVSGGSLILSQSAPSVQAIDMKTKTEREFQGDLFQMLNGRDYTLVSFKALLQTVDANTKDVEGRTLLLVACQNPDIPIEVITTLLAQGANPNEKLSYAHQPAARDPRFADYSCVSFAALNNRPDILQAFMESRVQPVSERTWTDVQQLYSNSGKQGENEEIMELISKGSNSSSHPSGARQPAPGS